VVELVKTTYLKQAYLDTFSALLRKLDNLVLYVSGCPVISLEIGSRQFFYGEKKGD